jgi:hypothetical protein
MALAAKPGTATLTISLTQGTGSPMEEAISIPQITLTAVGYSYWNENPTQPIDPAYPAMGGLIYTAGS